MRAESPKPTGSFLSKPAVTVRGVAIVAGVWVLFTLLFAGLIVASAKIPFVWGLSGAVITNLILAAYSIPPWFIVIREMDRAGWSWKILVHVVLAPLYAFAAYETNVFGFLMINGPVVLQQSGIEVQKVWIIYGNFTTYLIQFAIFHIIRSLQRLREQENQAAELRDLAREREISALKAQINPHFLFNTLHSISAKVSRDPEAARVMIAGLAELLRYALDSFEHAFVPLRDEIYFIEAYLSLEQQRFGDRLRFHSDIAEDVLEIPVPPMILQPLVENAIRHGIAPQEEGGEIRLRVARNEGKLVFWVQDDGEGIRAKNALQLNTNGIGLKNTDARLRKLFGEKSGLQFETRNGGGFTVSFAIPLALLEKQS